MAGKTESAAPKRFHLWFPLSAILLSFLSFSQLNDPATLPRTLVWSLLLFAWTLVLLRSLRKSGEEGLIALPLPLWAAMGLTLAAHLVSFSAAINVAESVLTTLRLVLMFSGVWLVASHLKLAGHKGRMSWMFVLWLTGLIQALIALVQYFTLGDKLPLGAPAGLLINPNLLGTLVTLSLPCAGFLLLRGLKPVRIAAGFSFAVTLPAIYLSESRAALLILLVFTLILLIRAMLSLRNLKGSNKVAIALGVPAAVVIAAVALYVGWGRKEMPKSLDYLWNSSANITPQTSSIEVRMVLWNRSMQMGEEHPITGVGAGNWKLVIPSLGVKGYNAEGTYGSVFYTRPHNDFAWVFAETGFPGLIGFTGFFVVLLAFSLRKRKGPEYSDEDRAIAFTGLLGIAGYMVDAFFSFPSERIENAMFLAVFAGFAMQPQASRMKRKNIPLIALCILLPVIASLAAYRLPMDRATFQLRNAKQKKQWDKTLQFAEAADDYWCRYEAQTATPITWYKAMARVEKARAFGPSHPQYSPLLNEALVEVETALVDAPWNFNAMSELGTTYSQLGRFPEAIAAFTNLTNTYPDNSGGWLNLAVSYYNNKQLAEARAAMAHVPGDYPDPNVATLTELLAATR